MIAVVRSGDMRPYGPPRKWYKELPIILVIYGTLFLLQVPCLFRYLLHIPCPGCGMTHALIAVFELDLSSAFQYHWMFWSLPFIGMLIWSDGEPFPWRIANDLCKGTILCGFILNYIRQLVICFSV